MAVSTAYVNQILPKDALGVSIPGHVIGYKSATLNSPIAIAAGTSLVQLISMTYTPVSSTSRLVISANLPNLRKTTGAGVNTWFSGLIRIDGQEIPEGNLFGAVGYPETFGDHRYNVFTHTDAPSYSGQKTITLHGTSASTGSEWIVSYQGVTSRLTVMEIAQ